MVVVDYVFDNNPAEVFYEGQRMTGRVLVETSEPIKVRAIKMRFSGEVKVRWSEKSGNTTTHYRGGGDLFANEVVLLQANPDPVIQPGNHSFPFVFDLAIGLPPSFEGDVLFEDSHVRYLAEAIVERPALHFNVTKQRAFTVMNVVDLNLSADFAMRPQQWQEEKTLCCCCCASGPIEARISIPRGGYVSGEGILIFAEIENHSSRNMTKSRVVLRQIVTRRVNLKTRVNVVEVANMVKDPIPAHSSDTWTGAMLRIPPLPPSFDVGVLKVEYKLVLQVSPSGPSFSLNVPLTLLIGTVPLRQVVAEYYADREQPPEGVLMPTLTYAVCEGRQVVYPYYDWSKPTTRSNFPINVDALTLLRLLLANC